MALNKEGPFGRMAGSVGDLTFNVVKGIGTVKGRQRETPPSATDAQIVVRNHCDWQGNFGRHVNEILKPIYWPHDKRSDTSYNIWFKKNYGVFDTKVFSLANPPIMSRGYYGIQPIVNYSNFRNQSRLRIHWRLNQYPPGALDNDIGVCVAVGMNSFGGDTYNFISVYDGQFIRRDLNFVANFDFTVRVGQFTWCSLFFISADGERLFADSNRGKRVN